MVCRQGDPILEVQVPHLIPAENKKETSKWMSLCGHETL